MPYQCLTTYQINEIVVFALKYSICFMIGFDKSCDATVHSLLFFSLNHVVEVKLLRDFLIEREPDSKIVHFIC